MFIVMEQQTHIFLIEDSFTNIITDPKRIKKKWGEEKMKFHKDRTTFSMGSNPYSNVPFVYCYCCVSLYPPSTINKLSNNENITDDVWYYLRKKIILTLCLAFQLNKFFFYKFYRRNNFQLLFVEFFFIIFILLFVCESSRTAQWMGRKW
jgi:hypothetical protein